MPDRTKKWVCEALVDILREHGALTNGNATEPIAVQEIGHHWIELVVGDKTFYVTVTLPRGANR